MLKWVQRLVRKNSVFSKLQARINEICQKLALQMASAQPLPIPPAAKKTIKQPSRLQIEDTARPRHGSTYQMNASYCITSVTECGHLTNSHSKPSRHWGCFSRPFPFPSFPSLSFPRLEVNPSNPIRDSRERC